MEATPLAMYNYFIDRVKSNLHVVLAMSPIGDAFRNRLRMFPSLINCCTIDWFQVSLHSCEFKQCGILTCVDSDEPVQRPFKIRNSKISSVSSLTLIEYSSYKQKLRSDCAYAQAGLNLCWSHIAHCWKSHVAAHMSNTEILWGTRGQRFHLSARNYE